MAFYEHVVVARPDMSPQQVEALTAQISEIIADNGGTVARTEYWGVRTLAHPIKKMRKAHYSLILMETPPQAVSELERRLRINEDVVRFLTLRVDALSSEPSAMIARRDRKPRQGRRDDLSRNDSPRSDSSRNDSPRNDSPRNDLSRNDSSRNDSSPAAAQEN